MSFYETPRFPERISYGATGGPTWSTEVVSVESGREKRNSRWAFPQHRWDVSHAVKTQDELDELRAFFLAMAGRTHAFRFKDWSDFAATTAQGKATGLTSTTFQLVKRYTFGAVSKDRQIVKPIATGFALFNSGAALVLTSDYTLDATTGIVTTVTPKTAANLSWSGQFDVPMRFDTDEFRAEIINASQGEYLYSLSDVPLLEVLL